MAETIRWGVLGNANIARVCVIRAIQRSRNGSVQALATRVPERAEETLVKHGIPHVYSDYQRLIGDPDIDAIYIPLPNHLHHPWTLLALQAGKHVLCEKPLACTAKQAREMFAAAQQAQLTLMEAFMYRFHPRSLRIKEMVSSGAIGMPCLVRTSFCYHMGEELLACDDNARLKPDMGGGALLDVGCYGASVARWMFDAEPTQVQAQALYHASGVDMHFGGLLRFPKGGLAVLEASFIAALQQTYAVIGCDGSIELPHDAFIPWEKDAAFSLRERHEEFGRQHVTPGTDQYQLMVEHFADIVLGIGRPAFSASESIANMEVLDALCEAARSGQTIHINKGE